MCRGHFDDVTTRFCVACVIEAFEYLHAKCTISCSRCVDPQRLTITRTVSKPSVVVRQSATLTLTLLPSCLPSVSSTATSSRRTSCSTTADTSSWSARRPMHCARAGSSWREAWGQRGYIFYAGASIAGAGYCRQCRRRPAILRYHSNCGRVARSV